MADNISAGGNTISSEEVTTLNGATVTAQQIQRVVSSMRTADGIAVDGVGIAQQIAGEDLVNNVLRTETRFTPNYISTATTTVVKTGAGVMHNIVIQGGTLGTVIIYDNTAASGTIIASFDTPTAQTTFTFNSTFATGLTVITSAATKLTVNYR